MEVVNSTMHVGGNELQVQASYEECKVVGQATRVVRCSHRPRTRYRDSSIRAGLKVRHPKGNSQLPCDAITSDCGGGNTRKPT